MEAIPLKSFYKIMDHIDVSLTLLNSKHLRIEAMSRLDDIVFIK